MNPALARIQVEGGVTQGIGLAMYEDLDMVLMESFKLLIYYNTKFQQKRYRKHNC